MMAHPRPALLELLLPAVSEASAVTYASTGGIWPSCSTWPRNARPLTLEQLRRAAAACPSTPADSYRWHQLVRRDAELDHPLTPHGRALRSSSRTWPGLGQIGECLCGSSLLFHLLPDAEADEQPSAAA